MTTLSLVIAVITTVVSIIGTLGTFIYWMISRVDNDIKSLRNDMISMNNEFSAWTKHLTAMQAEQSKRTDGVYNFILDILKKGE